MLFSCTRSIGIMIYRVMTDLMPSIDKTLQVEQRQVYIIRREGKNTCSFHHEFHISRIKRTHWINHHYIMISTKNVYTSFCAIKYNKQGFQKIDSKDSKKKAHISYHNILLIQFFRIIIWLRKLFDWPLTLI